MKPSKLTLMNPSGGFFHAISNSGFVLGNDEGGVGGWIDCVSLCLMRHPALTFFALINVTTGYGNSCRKTALLRVFQMLHKRATTLSNGPRPIDARNLDSQICTLSAGTGGIVTGAQLWSFASCHTACAVGQ